MAKVPSRTVYFGKAGWKNNPLTGMLTVPQHLLMDFENPGDIEKTAYSNVRALTGAGSKLHHWDAGVWGEGTTGPVNNIWDPPIRAFKRGDEAWFQMYMWTEPTWSWQSTGQGNQTKFMRMTTHNSDDSPGSGHLDWTIGDIANGQAWQYIYEGGKAPDAIDQSTGYKQFGTQADLPVNEQWQEYQAYARFDTQSVDDGGMAEVKFWKDDKLLFHNTSRRTLKDPEGYVDGFMVNPYWNGGAPKTQDAWVDRITITNKRPDFTDAQGNHKLPSILDYGN